MINICYSSYFSHTLMYKISKGIKSLAWKVSFHYSYNRYS